jgi:ribosomal protein S18 acetylase RimI-like enzyme
VTAVAGARTVRAARRADVSAVAALWVELVRAHAALDPALALEPGAADALEREVARALGDADAAVWVAEQDGRVVGFASARLERASSLAVERARVEITEIAVVPEARRRGIGRALAEAAVGWARRQRVARIEVRVAAGNAAGQGFWRALGYAPFVDVLSRRL